MLRRRENRGPIRAVGKENHVCFWRGTGLPGTVTQTLFGKSVSQRGSAHTVWEKTVVTGGRPLNENTITDTEPVNIPHSRALNEQRDTTFEHMHWATPAASSLFHRSEYICWSRVYTVPQFLFCSVKPDVLYVSQRYSYLLESSHHRWNNEFTFRHVMTWNLTHQFHTFTSLWKLSKIGGSVKTFQTEQVWAPLLIQVLKLVWLVTHWIAISCYFIWAINWIFFMLWVIASWLSTTNAWIMNRWTNWRFRWRGLEPGYTSCWF